MGEPKPWKEVGGPLRIFSSFFLKKSPTNSFRDSHSRRRPNTAYTHTDTQQIMEQDTLDRVIDFENSEPILCSNCTRTMTKSRDR